MKFMWLQRCNGWSLGKDNKLQLDFTGHEYLSMLELNYVPKDVFTVTEVMLQLTSTSEAILWMVWANVSRWSINPGYMTTNNKAQLNLVHSLWNLHIRHWTVFLFKTIRNLDHSNSLLVSCTRIYIDAANCIPVGHTVWYIFITTVHTAMKILSPIKIDIV